MLQKCNHVFSHRIPQCGDLFQGNDLMVVKKSFGQCLIGSIQPQEKSRRSPVVRKRCFLEIHMDMKRNSVSFSKVNHGAEQVIEN